VIGEARKTPTVEKPVNALVLCLIYSADRKMTCPLLA
jgi:hypothetical protein